MKTKSKFNIEDIKSWKDFFYVDMHGWSLEFRITGSSSKQTIKDIRAGKHDHLLGMELKCCELQDSLELSHG